MSTQVTSGLDLQGTTALPGVANHCHARHRSKSHAGYLKTTLNRALERFRTSFIWESQSSKVFNPYQTQGLPTGHENRRTEEGQLDAHKSSNRIWDFILPEKRYICSPGIVKDRLQGTEP